MGIRALSCFALRARAVAFAVATTAFLRDLSLTAASFLSLISRRSVCRFLARFVASCKGGVGGVTVSGRGCNAFRIFPNPSLSHSFIQRIKTHRVVKEVYVPGSVRQHRAPGFSAAGTRP